MNARSGASDFNAFIQPIIDRYGYTQNGVKTGGGIVGYGLQFDNDDFWRDEAQFAYNHTLGTSVVHELHVGYQWLKESEDLLRASNGWGAISVPGGRLAPVNGQRAYYVAEIQQQLLGENATPSTARDCATTHRRCPATWQRPGTSTRCTRSRSAR